jgi:hypothetical protein
MASKRICYTHFLCRFSRSMTMTSDNNSLYVGGSVEKNGLVVKGKGANHTSANAYPNSIVIIFLPETNCRPVNSKIA